MISVKNVTKKYGKNTVADNVSFEVPDGQISVLLGPNGAGKSTIIKCICGLLRFSGEITIGGHPNRSLEAKRLLGYVPEMPALYDLLTVEEHLEFIARAYRLDNWKELADRLLERFELSDKRKKLGKELSKGMQQKVSICCALLFQPKSMIFDEPMVGLDPHAIKELKEIFQELRARGVSLLISTHMLDSVEDYWDAAQIMMQGKIAASGGKAALLACGKSLEEQFFEITENRGDSR